MYLAYLDETYRKDREHAVLALVIPAGSVVTLEKLLDGVVCKAHQQHEGVPVGAELHGYELNAGSGDWASLKSSPRARVRIFRAAIEAIVSIEGARLCRGSVDLRSRNPADAHEWALTFALERVNASAGSADAHVLGICDDVGNKSVYQNMYADARQNGTGGHYPNKLERFVDGLHFTPSCHSRPVQAVDMLSYVYRKKHIAPPVDPRSKEVYDELWEKVVPLADRGTHRKW